MTDAGIFAREFAALDRPVQVGVAGGKVISLTFPERVPADAEGDHPILDRIEGYLAGDADGLADVEVALTVPTDQRAVLEAVQQLPPGRTVGVDRVARLAGLDTGDEDDADERDGDGRDADATRRTVETALRENPVPLFVPDHRVEAPGATPDTVARALRRLEA